MEQLNEALATLINQATTGIDTSIGFLQAEIPDVITQLLMWHGVRSVILTVIGVLLSVVFPLVFYRVYKFAVTPYSEPREHTEYSSVKMNSRLYGKWYGGQQFADTGWSVLLGISGAISVVGFAVGLSLLNLTWLQIWIAPKIFLIEYAANLVK
jgi:uncharacterized membrane protein